MKFLSRDFTQSEKTVLLALLILLSALAYYNFVHVVVRRQMAEAVAERDQLQSDLSQLQTQLAELNKMRNELNDLDGKGGPSYMASYNNIKEEMTLLNGILAPATQYTIGFSSVTRNGDLIRRSITLQYTVPDFYTARKILEELARCQDRCLLGDISYSNSTYTAANGARVGQININVTCTFYETMVGGVADAGLPPDQAARQSED